MMLTKVEDGLGMTCVRGKLVWADPLPPFPPILTIPTIIYHTYPPCPTHHYLPTLHSILTLSTILCHNTLKSACVVCLFMAAFLLNILYCTYYIKRNLPFFLGSRYVECNMQGAVYSNTKPYNITRIGFPLCGVSSYA